MNALGVVACALAFAGRFQAPATRPQWLSELERIQAAAASAPLGSLDAEVDGLWAAALGAPHWPELLSAAQHVSSYYDMQGYDLKSEQALRDALAAVPKDGDGMRLALRSQLAYHFECVREYAKAAALWEELVKSAPDPAHRASLARVYEFMGELDKAEALWTAAADESKTPPTSGSSAQSITGGLRGSFFVAYPGTASNELAAFYQRHGRASDAERVYKSALAATAEAGPLSAWLAAADSYIVFLSQQRRFDEALDLAGESLSRVERSREPVPGHSLFARRSRLAQVLAQAGRAEAALAAQRQAAEDARSDDDSSESVRAFAALAQALMNEQRFDEAESAIGRMREVGARDGSDGRFHESMAVQMLARIRDLQNKPDEARRLRESVGVPDVTAAQPRPATIYDLIGPGQQKAIQGDVDAAVAAAAQALALAPAILGVNPREAATVISLAQVLADRGRPDAARRVALELLALLDRAPDHPAVADALGAMVAPLCNFGLVAEAERAIDREERILVRAKGPQAFALNAAGHGRVALLQRDSDWTGIVEQRKRMLARAERAAGPKGVEALTALREVAWAYVPLDNWPEEQRVLADLLERTLRLHGRASIELATLFEHMANRAAANGQVARAIDWVDQGIEVARSLPEGGGYLQGLGETRARILREPPAGAPPGRARAR